MAAEILFFPIMAILMLTAVAIAIFFFVLWIWMIVDCAQRNFKNDNEKIVWILVIVLASWIGAIIYYFVIKEPNIKGVSKKK